jgi:hypothetical protein
VIQKGGINQSIFTCRLHDPLLKGPKNSTRKLLEIINSLIKVAGNKINRQKSVTFLYINNEQKEIRERILYIISSNSIKYIGINLVKLTKDLFNENYKPLKREIKEDIRRYQDHPLVDQ